MPAKDIYHGELLMKNQRVRLVVFDHQNEEVVQWIP